jgi:hypothetical protein
MGTAAADARQRQGSPSAQLVPPAPWMQILPRELWRKRKDGFVFHLDFTPLAANGNATLPLNVSADADFVIIFGTRIVTAVDNVTFIANVPELVTIVDTGAGRALSSSPVHIDEWFGTGQLPAYWAYPKFLRANSSLSVTLSSLEAVARNVRLSFHGFKVFNFNEDEG